MYPKTRRPPAFLIEHSKDVCAHINVYSKCVSNSGSNPFFKKNHFIPVTNLIRMRCISEMSYMPVCVMRGLSHLYLFTKAVVCNDKPDTLNQFAHISLTVQINKK